MSGAASSGCWPSAIPAKLPWKGSPRFALECTGFFNERG